MSVLHPKELEISLAHEGVYSTLQKVNAELNKEKDLDHLSKYASLYFQLLQQNVVCIFTLLACSNANIIDLLAYCIQQSSWINVTKKLPKVFAQLTRKQLIRLALLCANTKDTPTAALPLTIDEWLDIEDATILTFLKNYPTFKTKFDSNIRILLNTKTNKDISSLAAEFLYYAGKLDISNIDYISNKFTYFSMLRDKARISKSKEDWIIVEQYFAKEQLYNTPIITWVTFPLPLEDLSYIEVTTSYLSLYNKYLQLYKLDYLPVTKDIPTDPVIIKFLATWIKTLKADRLISNTVWTKDWIIFFARLWSDSHTYFPWWFMHDIELLEPTPYQEILDKNTGNWILNNSTNKNFTVLNLLLPYKELHSVLIATYHHYPYSNLPLPDELNEAACASITKDNVNALPKVFRTKGVIGYHIASQFKININQWFWPQYEEYVNQQPKFLDTPYLFSKPAPYSVVYGTIRYNKTKYINLVLWRQSRRNIYKLLGLAYLLKRESFIRELATKINLSEEEKEHISLLKGLT